MFSRISERFGGSSGLGATRPVRTSSVEALRDQGGEGRVGGQPASAVGSQPYCNPIDIEDRRRSSLTCRQLGRFLGRLHDAAGDEPSQLAAACVADEDADE